MIITDIKQPKRQKNRHLKMQCDKVECGIIIRTTKLHMDKIEGNPICINPLCDGTMEFY